MIRISALSLLLLPALGLAQTDADPISFHYLEVGYLDADLDVAGAEMEGNGLGLEYSVDVRDHVHLFGAYESFELDGVDGDSTRKLFGIGTHFNLTDRLGVYGGLAYTDVDFDAGTGNVGDDGATVSGGVRYVFGDGWEVRGGAEYVTLDDGGSDTFVTVGGDFFVTDAVALSIDVEDRDETTTALIGLRFYFDFDTFGGRVR